MTGLSAGTTTSTNDPATANTGTRNLALAPATWHWHLRAENWELLLAAGQSLDRGYSEWGRLSRHARLG